MKIFKVTFNDGGWHSSLPSFMAVANTKEEAIEKIRVDESRYDGWDCWASEFKMNGYIIEVYEESTYKGVIRDRKIDVVNEK